MRVSRYPTTAKICIFELNLIISMIKAINGKEKSLTQNCLSWKTSCLSLQQPSKTAILTDLALTEFGLHLQLVQCKNANRFSSSPSSLPTQTGNINRRWHVSKHFVDFELI